MNVTPCSWAQPGGGYGATSNDVRSGSLANNYSRPSGQQNVVRTC